MSALSPPWGELLLLTTPGLPLLLGSALLVWPRVRPLRLAGALAATPALLAGLLLSPGAIAPVPWLMEGGDLAVDAAGRWFLLFGALVWLAAGLVGWATADTPRRGRLLGWMGLAMGGNLGLILGQNVLVFYLFFALMSLSIYPLVIHDRSARAAAAGRLYMVLAMAADLMLFAALVLAAWHSGGDLSFDGLGARLLSSPHSPLVLWLVLVGFGVKVGVLGVHVVMPVIYRVVPVAAGIALAGAMLNAGVLGWLRLFPLGEEVVPGWAGGLMAAGVITAFYAVLAGLPQRRPAVVLAYSSVSQMGIVTAAVGAGFAARPTQWPWISEAIVLYALHHGLAKAALFLGAGIAVARLAGWRRIAAAVGLLVPALALTGAPFTSGMLAKALLKESLHSVEHPATTVVEALLPWLAFATTLIVARFLWLVWRAPTGDVAAGRVISAVWLALTVLVLTGTWWVPLREPPELWTAAALWATGWPLLAGACLAVATAVPGVRGRLPAPPRVPVGDLLVPLAGCGRAVVAVWRAAVEGALPAGREAVRERLWRARAAALERLPLDRAEALLGDWPVATTLFVVLAALLVLAAR